MATTSLTIQPANSPPSPPLAASSTSSTSQPVNLPPLPHQLPRRGSDTLAVSQPTSPRAAPSRLQRLFPQSRSSQIKHATSRPPTTRIRPSTSSRRASALPRSKKAPTRTRKKIRQTTTPTSHPTYRRCPHHAASRHARQVCHRRARAARASATASPVLAIVSSSTVVDNAAATPTKIRAPLTLMVSTRLASLHVVMV